MMSVMVWLLACSNRDDGLTLEQLQDPQACAECHPEHHRQWSGSMHAYASEDPVFRALNERGQEETGGALGDFCVQCHAPLAVELGLTTDGLDLDTVPEHLRGITCYYCHQIESVTDDHNNPLQIAMDRTMRGGIRDPIESTAHPTAYSALLDRNESESSRACGSCHDIITPLGAHIERTHFEWQDSLFSQPLFGLNCGSCHMGGSDGLAAEVEGVPLRRIHDHSMPGMDLALTPFPEAEAQRAAVQEILDDTVVSYLCVQPPTGDTTLAVVSLENVAGGHYFPSGATADRRVWVELEAYAGGERIWSSGAIADDAPLADSEDPDLWRIHSTLLDATGEPTHDFWEAADIDYGDLLVVQTTLDPTDPAYVQTHQARNYLIRGGIPDRVVASVKARPVPLDLIDELIAEGRLAPEIRDAIPTFTLGPTRLEWTAEVPVNSGSLACVPEPPPDPAAGSSTP